MNILHLIPSLRKGGAERLVLDICRELAGRPGIRCKLVVMRGENDYPQLCEGLDIERCSSRVVPSITGKWQIDLKHWQQIVQEFQPDIIHSHLFEAEMMSRAWLYPKAAYFSHCHDNMPQLNRLSTAGFFSKQKLTNFYERSFLLPRYRQVHNQFVAISEHTAANFGKHLPRSLAANVHLLHNAIHYHTFFRSLNGSKTTGQPLKLVSVGSLVPKKNQAFLPQVVQHLQQNGFPAELHLLGDGPNRQQIENQIVQTGLEQSVMLHGNVDDVPAHLHRADIYVHAATYEPFGLVLLEAMAAGLPVVCLDGGGNRDLIVQGENGFMVGQPSPEQFAERIKQLATQPELYRQMAANAQQFAAGYDIAPYCDKLLQLYEKAVPQKSQSPNKLSVNAL